MHDEFKSTKISKLCNKIAWPKTKQFILVISIAAMIVAFSYHEMSTLCAKLMPGSTSLRAPLLIPQRFSTYSPFAVREYGNLKYLQRSYHQNQVDKESKRELETWQIVGRHPDR